MTTPGTGDPHPRRTVRVLDPQMSYVDTGGGDPIVFLAVKGGHFLVEDSPRDIGLALAAFVREVRGLPACRRNSLRQQGS